MIHSLAAAALVSLAAGAAPPEGSVPSDPPVVESVAEAAEICIVDGDEIFDDGHSVVFGGVGNDIYYAHDRARCVLRALGLPEWLWEVVEFGPFLTEIEQFDFDGYGVVIVPDGEEAVQIAVFETDN